MPFSGATICQALDEFNRPAAGGKGVPDTKVRAAGGSGCSPGFSPAVTGAGRSRTKQALTSEQKSQIETERHRPFGDGEVAPPVIEGGRKRSWQEGSGSRPHG
jgi:hypothetical protein